MLKLDHLILAAVDIEAAAARLELEHGLEAYRGGDHPAWGTGNVIVPLGGEYLEILGVRDRAVAQESPLGRWLLAHTADGDRLAGLAVETDDLDGVCARLGLTPMQGGRALPDGGHLVWRMAGLEVALAESLPFFIEWGDERPTDPDAAGGIREVVLGGDETRLRGWLGDEVPGLRLAGGAPGVRSATVDAGRAPVVL